MANRFFDTSAVVKHYRSEVGTARDNAFLAEAGSRHHISVLLRLNQVLVAQTTWAKPTSQGTDATDKDLAMLAKVPD
jgi:hypothetical protein